MTEQEKRLHRCCFAGHRPEAIPLSETAARDWLREQIQSSISCRHVHGRIRHLFTSFDDRNPDAVGNRYLICFTSTKQAERTPSPPTVDDALDSGPSFDNLDERYDKRRKKGNTTTWAVEAGETALVSTGKVLAYVHRSHAVGGLVFNPGDEKHSLAIAKFLLE